MITTAHFPPFVRLRQYPRLVVDRESPPIIHEHAGISMRFLSTAIILCTALLGPAAALRAQPADHPQMMLPMPEFVPPTKTLWAAGVHAGYTLGMHSAFPASPGEGASDGEFGFGAGHGFNMGIGITRQFIQLYRLSLLGHLMFERRPGSFERTIGRYDAVDADGAPVATTAAERADLRYDMIAADLLFRLSFRLPRFQYNDLDLIVALGPSLGYVMSASSDRRITVPGPYHLPARPGALYEDDGRTLLLTGVPDGLRRFHAGITLGIGLDMWYPWAGQTLSVGLLFDYALTGASSGNDWRAHALRVNFEWSRDVRNRHSVDDGGSQPL